MKITSNIKNGTLVAFGELYLKSPGVRRLLKKKLVGNIASACRRVGVSVSVRDMHDRLFIPSDSPEVVKPAVRDVFGSAWLADAMFIPDADAAMVRDIAASNYSQWIPDGNSYAIRLRRESAVTQTREEIIDAVAGVIDRPVRLTKPDCELFIDARADGAFIYFKKERARGGLPVGSQQQAMVLLSAGIDSPVAAYYAAKRGALTVWLHFHSFPLVSKKSIEKTRELARVFTRFQPALKIYFVPFGDIQMAIRGNAPERYRILLYRRAMMNIAEKIAQHEACFALFTGESLGQVGSQTSANLSIVDDAVGMPVLRPVVGFDKEEIIAVAQDIGTFEISIRPQEDCCTLFTPPHPTAEGRLSEVHALEKNLRLAPLLRSAIKNAEIENF